MQCLSWSRAGVEPEDPNHLAIAEGPGIKGVWVRPVPQLIVGEVKKWAEQAHVECVKIPGYWMEKRGIDRLAGSPPKPGEKVLYHLHGGGYFRLSAHPNDQTSRIPRGILEHTPIERSFNLEYRLTKGPPHTHENPFPAALLDAIAGYHYLIHDVGFAPENIIVEGDSAGANLALALVRYLLENAENASVKLPGLPSALVLCSPWTHLGDLRLPKHSPLRKEVSVYTNRHSDFINVTGRSSLRETTLFFGPLGPDGGENNRYISPGSESPKMDVSFKGFPRTLILCGGAEIFKDQIRVLAERMTRDIGADMVEYVEFPDAMHDWLTLPWHEPERTEALRRVSRWLFPWYAEPKGLSWIPRAKL